MRKDLARLKTLRDNLIGLEMDLDITEKELDILDKDVGYLEIARSTLLENLKILKKEKVIAIASQYKKTIAELQYVEDKIIAYRKHIFSLEQKLKKLERLHSIYLTDYKEQKRLVESQKVILVFDPKRKKKSGANEG